MLVKKSKANASNFYKVGTKVGENYFEKLSHFELQYLELATQLHI
jgi:hypothetical protein